jgi:DNA-directed RNA polymerase III subunit RPC2
MGTVPVEDEEWEQANRTNWKGLGLTDPIKSIEVCAYDTLCRMI